ncbi:hypothetical protein CBS101457_000118 [Exobasidium rhododendri]|nr:hypothetical protein CBS101457_000118 [Exobasidium rhododendri]
MPLPAPMDDGHFNFHDQSDTFHLGKIKTRGKGKSHGESSRQDDDQRSRTSRASTRNFLGNEGSRTSRPSMQYAPSHTSHDPGNVADYTHYGGDPSAWDQHTFDYGSYSTSYGNDPTRNLLQNFSGGSTYQQEVNEDEQDHDQTGRLRRDRSTTDLLRNLGGSSERHGHARIRSGGRRGAQQFDHSPDSDTPVPGHVDPHAYNVHAHHFGYPAQLPYSMDQLNANYTQAMNLASLPHPALIENEEGDEEYADEEDEAPAVQASAQKNDEMRARLIDMLDVGKSAFVPGSNVFITPAEYLLQVSPHIAFEPDMELYDCLSDLQIMVMSERIRQIRPYSLATIQQQLRRVLKLPTAQALLGNDQTVWEAGVEMVYRLNARKKGSHQMEWMLTLRNPQRRLVVDRFVEATDQAPDVVREGFLKHKLTIDEATSILEATPETIVQFAEARGLIFPRVGRKMPWYKGLGNIQKEALYQRMVAHGIGEAYVRKILRRKYIPEGFGRAMLRADDDTFHNVMLILRHLEGTGRRRQ